MDGAPGSNAGQRQGPAEEISKPDVATLVAAIEQADASGQWGDVLTAIRAAVLELERERNIYASVLRLMSTAGPLDGEDSISRAYQRAGGGYEGLQAMAQAGLVLGGALP